jgi:hypothetical protein
MKPSFLQVPNFKPWQKAKGVNYSTALLPRAYPYSNSYVTTPSFQRVLNTGDNQTSDPRASGAYGAPSWTISNGNSSVFFPSINPIGGIALDGPGNNTRGLSLSNLVVMGALAVAVFLLFFRRS